MICMLPTYKRGYGCSALKETNFGSYRSFQFQVSDLSFLGMVVEKLVTEQLQNFLADISALKPFQSGFWSGHGKEMALVALTDDLCRQFHQGGLMLLLLLDLTAVLDMVNHDLLTHCLTDVGVCGVILKWLTSFLKGQG